MFEISVLNERFSRADIKFESRSRVSFLFLSLKKERKRKNFKEA